MDTQKCFELQEQTKSRQRNFIQHALREPSYYFHHLARKIKTASLKAFFETVQPFSPAIIGVWGGKYGGFYLGKNSFSDQRVFSFSLQINFTIQVILAVSPEYQKCVCIRAAQ